MTGASDLFLFGVAPYVAAFSLVAFTLLRYLLARQGGRLTAREALTARKLFGRHAAWTIGLAGTAAFHVLLLGFPEQLLVWSSHPARLVALEIAFFAFGVAAFVGALALIVRHASRRRWRGRASVADAAFLAALLVCVVSGLGMAVLYRWAAAWSAVTVVPYARSLFDLDPAVALVRNLPYVVRLHVFSAVVTLALFPLTHWVDALLVPADRLRERMTAPVRALAARSRRSLEEAVRVGGRRLGWSEEED